MKRSSFKKLCLDALVGIAIAWICVGGILLLMAIPALAMFLFCTGHPLTATSIVITACGIGAGIQEGMGDSL